MLIIVSGLIEVSPEGREEAAAAALAMSRSTMQEEGCLHYSFYSDLSDPNIFRVYEEWKDLACLQAHFETPHMNTFRERLSNIKIVSRSIKRYHVDQVADL